MYHESMSPTALLGLHFIVLLPAIALFLLAIGLAFHRMPDLLFFRRILLILFLAVFLVTWLGLFVYVPYRSPGNARSVLLETRPELHKIVFEHKEFAAYAVWLLLLVALIGVWSLSNDEYHTTPRAHTLIRFCLIAAFAITLLVSVEGLIVTTAAPVQ